MFNRQPRSAYPERPTRSPFVLLDATPSVSFLPHTPLSLQPAIMSVKVAPKQMNPLLACPSPPLSRTRAHVPIYSHPSCSVPVVVGDKPDPDKVMHLCRLIVSSSFKAETGESERADTHLPSSTRPIPPLSTTKRRVLPTRCYQVPVRDRGWTTLGHTAACVEREGPDWDPAGGPREAVSQGHQNGTLRSVPTIHLLHRRESKAMLTKLPSSASQTTSRPLPPLIFSLLFK